MENKAYKFGEFELSFPEGQLRAGTSMVRLQDKPLLLLCELLDHPQQLVTRQQLRERMWDRRTVVNFEQRINVAIKKVRDALGDSSETPRYIETVARKGYRLRVPVEVVIDTSNPSEVTEATILTDLARVRPRFNGHLRRILLLVFTAGVIGAFGFRLSGFQTRTRQDPPIRSIAVLPLQDLSPDVGQEYFADGITDEIITNLAQTLPLRVISRSSVMRFKRTELPVAEIARELGVEAIVEGSVARSGDRVNVTVQLIDAAEDRHLWARTYERRLEDILTLESELSGAIASRISGTLTSQPTKLSVARTRDPQVYDLCLMGRYHWNRRTTTDLVKAEAYYQRAIAADPTYAPAFAGLAKVYALMPHVGTLPFADSLEKSKTAAHRALELDEDLAEAHATLGFVALNTASEWKGSDVELLRALELDPNDATTHHWLAFYLLFAGRSDEALAEIELARQLDPMSGAIYSSAGHLLYATRHFAEARVALGRSIELAPDYGRPHATMALLELETGHPSEALEQARTALALTEDDPNNIGEVGYVFARTGKTAEARALLATLTDPNRRGGRAPIFAAMIELGLGERHRALDWITRADGTYGLGQYLVFDELNADIPFTKTAGVSSQ
jgi:TolB-like protein/DNA-binding winged helix-turn-helix (wHTH) protein/Tfp pilus assembly protein PilF